MTDGRAKVQMQTTVCYCLPSACTFETKCCIHLVNQSVLVHAKTGVRIIMISSYSGDGESSQKPEKHVIKVNEESRKFWSAVNHHDS